jgi:hypothetical protein
MALKFAFYIIVSKLSFFRLFYYNAIQYLKGT